MNLKSIKAPALLSLSFTGLALPVALYHQYFKQPDPQIQPPAEVFYPHHITDDCIAKINLLKSGRLEGTKGNLISLKPDWSLDDYRLHSLRFLDCLILESEQGNLQSFDLAKRIILDWDVKNNFSRKVNTWTWQDDKGAWSEHGVSWRAVLLSYFYRVSQEVAPHDRALTRHLQQVAKEHAEFLSSDKPYMANHNHGINNALGLLALGTAFQELPQSRKWVDLSLSRAEQQMRDNVSDDGVHLEQSGFYHFYTLRTFMEIFKAAQAIDRPLSAQYGQKLDQMLEVGALMAGINRTVEGVPWNNYDVDVFDLIKNGFPLNLGTSTPGKDLFEEIRQGSSERQLFVKSSGGFSFFTGDFGKDLEITFHTRILAGPHAQPDVLGVTANLGEQRILTYGNYTSSSRKGKDFNTVLVSDLEQGATLKSSPETPLRERLIPKGGEVLASGSSLNWDFVTARHQAYVGVTHTRTVARVGTNYLLVWDRLEADKAHEFVQNFHFPISAQVITNNRQGTAQIDEKPIARFVQLEEGLDINICDAQSQNDELCSQENDDSGTPTPTPEISYRSEGETAEFLWVLYAGDGQLEAQVTRANDSGAASKIVTLSGDGGEYRIRLQGADARLE